MNKTQPCVPSEITLYYLRGGSVEIIYSKADFSKTAVEMGLYVVANFQTRIHIDQIESSTYTSHSEC